MLIYWNQPIKNVNIAIAAGIFLRFLISNLCNKIKTIDRNSKTFLSFLVQCLCVMECNGFQTFKRDVRCIALSTMLHCTHTNNDKWRWPFLCFFLFYFIIVNWMEWRRKTTSSDHIFCTSKIATATIFERKCRVPFLNINLR